MYVFFWTNLPKNIRSITDFDIHAKDPPFW